MKYSSSLFAGVTLIDPCSWCVPQLLYLLHQTLLSAIVYYCLPVCPGVFLLVLLLSAGCCCLLRPATHAPLLFRRDTNLQTLLALRSNLSGQGISCPMCSGETAAGDGNASPLTSEIQSKFMSCVLCSAGVFMEKPHPLYTHISSSSFKFSAHQQTPITTTATAPRSSVKSSTNQTGKTSSAEKSEINLFNTVSTFFFKSCALFCFF